MSKRRVSSITYGAIFCALIGVLLLINRQLANFLDVYLFWIIPIPIIIYSIKFGTKQTLIMDAAILGVALIVTGFDFVTFTYTFASIVAGTIYGYGVNRQKSAFFLICSVIVVSLILMVVSTFLLGSLFGYDVVGEIEYLQQLMVSMFTTDADSTTAQLVTETFSYDVLLRIYILSCILSSVLEGILVHLIAYLVLRRLKMKLPPMKSISEIYAPTWMKVFVFASYVAYFAAAITQVSDYNDIILVLLVVSQLICVVFGYFLLMTILSQYIHKRRWIILIVVISFLLIGYTMNIYVTLGLVDMFSNTRRRINERVRTGARQN